MSNEIRIGPDGTLTYMQDDQLDQTLARIGEISVDRASHVEPVVTPGGIAWAVYYADGRDTGERFASRKLALDWEHENFWRLIAGR